MIRLYCNSPNSYLRRSSQTVFYYLLKCLNERLAPVMPYLGQELYEEIHNIDSNKEMNDIFQNQFTYLDKQLTDISPELASTMKIVLHLRDTFHQLLQSRRGILFDMKIYLNDKAQKQVATMII